MGARSLFLISAAGLVASQQTNPFVVTTTAQGAFSITLPQWEGFALTSANDIGFQSGGKWLSSGSGLTASAYFSFGGSDSWGDYNATSLTWLDAGGKPALVTTISVYSNTPAVVFGTRRAFTLDHVALHSNQDTSFRFYSSPRPILPCGGHDGWLRRDQGRRRLGLPLLCPPHQCVGLQRRRHAVARPFH